MKKKLFLVFLAVAAAICLALGLSACGKKKDSSHVHSYGEWEVTVEPTCTQDGEKTRECKRCGAKIDEKIPVKPTNHYIDEGKDTTVCSGCGTKLATSMALEISSNGKYAILKEAEGTAVIVPAVYHGIPVTSIGYRAFYGCTSLESVTIPDSVTSIGYSAFYNCTSLASVTIGNGVTEINDYAFGGCTSLESVTIPDSVTSIGDAAFGGCTSLENVTIGNGVTSIGERAFGGCTSLESIEVGAENQNYSSQDGILFNKDKTIIICVPGGKSAVSIPDSVTEIGNYAFSGCTSLESITIPDSVTSIGYRAFSGCTSLESVTIPDSVTSIGNYAFWVCTSLENVTIGNGVTSIGESAFGGCTSLESIEVDEENQNYSSQDGILYNKEKTKLICVPGGKSAVSIPNSVTTIGYSAFYNCTSLTSITIPDSVTEIGNSAFYNCTSLESITIPDSVTSIGESAFGGCTSLESVTFKNTAGWEIYYSYGYSHTVVDVTNPVDNARYLKNTYRNYTWRREG